MTPDHLALALEDGFRFDDMTLQHRNVGELLIPSGRLVACDAFVFPEMSYFAMPFPTGVFPVVLSIAEYVNDQRVAFATVRFRPSEPVGWDMLTIGDQNLAALKPDEIFGYPVDSGTGCFMDAIAARQLDETMRKDETIFERLMAEMQKTYIHTWSWLNVKVGDGNLIAFSSGFGDGVYANYVGIDDDGEASVVVTDFGVVA